MGKVIRFNIEELKKTKYGKLLLLEDLGYSKGGYLRFGLFQCDCGTTKQIAITSVFRGKSKSCGCSKTDVLIERNTTHGLSYTEEFKTWMKVRERCYSVTCSEYIYYGARGIKMSEEWYNDFTNFYNDMGKRPSKLHSIERIDVNGLYCKENCEWVTHKVQCNNRRNNIKITYNNKTQTSTMWEEELGIRKGLVSQRIRNGWDKIKALTEPTRIQSNNGKEKV